MPLHLFPIDSYLWFYAAFVAFIITLLVLDLKVFHRKSHAVSSKEAGLWSLFWCSLALGFGVVVYLVAPKLLAADPRLAGWTGEQIAKATRDLTIQYLNGYLIEICLSVDNLFVFVVVFQYFRIPGPLQHRILFFGILGAIVFRAIFIAAASFLTQFHWVLIVMGAFLVWTGLKMFKGSDEEIEPENNLGLKILRRFYPVTSRLDGDSFFTLENGRKAATPLLVTLIVVEMTDIVFAVDSVPAVFGVTQEPLVVFTSNMFAILGLRTLYFLLANAVQKFHLLKYGLGVILMFVGLKMCAFDPLGWKLPPLVSLAVILGLLTISIVMSLTIPPKSDEATQQPGPHA